MYLQFMIVQERWLSPWRCCQGSTCCTACRMRVLHPSLSFHLTGSAGCRATRGFCRGCSPAPAACRPGYVHGVVAPQPLSTGSGPQAAPGLGTEGLRHGRNKADAGLGAPTLRVLWTMPCKPGGAAWLCSAFEAGRPSPRQAAPARAYASCVWRPKLTKHKRVVYGLSVLAERAGADALLRPRGAALLLHKAGADGQAGSGAGPSSALGAGGWAAGRSASRGGARGRPGAGGWGARSSCRGAPGGCAACGPSRGSTLAQGGKCLMGG